jgi:outer membrane protein assembly factor BamE (lipoprotein component of BamABCDE complex)
MLGALAISGCAYESGQRDISDTSRISQIQKGSSTKEQIHMLFGSPKGTEFAANDDETWTYSYWSSTYDPVHVPQEPHRVFRASTLNVTFDKRGIVKAYAVASDDYTSRIKQ